MTSLLALSVAVVLTAGSDPSRDRVISVSGSAEVMVAPDVVQLMFAIETSDTTIAKAKAVNDERTTKSIAAIKKVGVEAKDVMTETLQIEPTYDTGVKYNPRASTDPDGYKVRRSIFVSLRDVKKFEDLIAAALDAGTNRLEGYEFQTTQLRKHRDTARANALRAAREKATAMAAELQGKIGLPLSISEVSSGAGLWHWQAVGRGGGYGQNSITQADFGGGSGSGESGPRTFAPGQISVTATVNVTFKLQD